MKTLILSLSVLLSFSGCDLLSDSSNNSTSIHKSVNNGGIEFSLDIPTNSFLLDDTLSISFKVKNYSTSTKEFYFSNIEQLSYQVIDQHNDIATYYPNAVRPATSYFSLNPGEIKELNQIGLFKDYNGNYINRGKYLLSVFLANNNSPKLKLEISVN
jgi:hypothetical protein